MIRRNHIPLFCFLALFLLSGCQVFPTPPAEAVDQTDYYVWVGDDRLESGPLDLQTLLFLETGGYAQPLQMERLLAPRNVLSFAPPAENIFPAYQNSGRRVLFLQLFGLQQALTEEEFTQNAEAWLEAASGSGVEIVLVYPWPSQVDSPETAAQMDALAHQFAWKHDLVLIPLAPAWRTVQKGRPDIRLYASDGIHPSPEGVYLSACVFYTAITGESPVGLAARTSAGYDQPDEIVTLDADTVLALQSYAWQTMQDYRQKAEFKVFLIE